MNIRIRYRDRGAIVTVAHGDDSVTVDVGNGSGVAHALDIAAGSLHADAYVRHRETRDALQDAVRSTYPYANDEMAPAARAYHDAVNQLHACQYMRAPHLTLGAIRNGEPGWWKW